MDVLLAQVVQPEVVQPPQPQPEVRVQPKVQVQPVQPDQVMGDDRDAQGPEGDRSKWTFKIHPKINHEPRLLVYSAM